MPLDAPHQCPYCPEAFHREKGLQDHINRTHHPAHAPPPPAHIVGDSGETPQDVHSQEELRYALWSAYLRHRFSQVHLGYEDIRILDNLAALAASYRGP